MNLHRQVENSCNISIIREMLGRKDVKTAIIYTDILNLGGQKVY